MSKRSNNSQRLNKLNVFYRRISTKGQDLSAQRDSDRAYREDCHPDSILEIEEIASANILKLKDRPEIQKLITLIKRGRVGTVYVYDRSRLARNYYDYISIFILLQKHKIGVIFTTGNKEYLPFSHDILYEAVNAIQADEEGKSIKRRNIDRQKKIPTKKFGYKVIRNDNNEIIEYKLNLSQAKQIEILFRDVKTINNYEDFIEFIIKKSKVLKKTTFDILRYLCDAFYAGCELNFDELKRIHNVEPIITESKFKKAQKIIRPHVETSYRHIDERTNEDIYRPLCGKCSQEMNYRRSNIGKSGVYTCAHKHKKIEISVEEYNDMVSKTFSKVLTNLDQKLIKEDAISKMNKILSHLRNEIQSVNVKIEQLEKDIAIKGTDFYKKNIRNLLDYQQESNKLIDDYTDCENYKKKIESLYKILDRLQIDKYEMIHRIPLIFQSILIKENYISFKLYFNEYLNIESLENNIWSDLEYAN